MQQVTIQYSESLAEKIKRLRRQYLDLIFQSQEVDIAEIRKIEDDIFFHAQQQSNKDSDYYKKVNEIMFDLRVKLSNLGLVEKMDLMVERNKAIDTLKRLLTELSELIRESN